MIHSPPDYVNEFFAKIKPERTSLGELALESPRRRIICKTGLKLSVQASQYHYSLPRENGRDHYTHVELGFPSVNLPPLARWKEDDEADGTDTVYPYVPVGVLNAIIDCNGGIDYDAVRGGEL